MRRILLLVPLLAVMAIPSMAQDRSDRIGLGIGASYRYAGDAVLFWEHETRYHNAWEVFAEGQLLLPEDRPGCHAFGTAASDGVPVWHTNPASTGPGTGMSPRGSASRWVRRRRRFRPPFKPVGNSPTRFGADGSSTGRREPP